MSGIALAWVATVTVGNQTAKQLLQFYAGHNFASDNYLFKNSTLAKQLEVTERAIRNAHRFLMENGWIKKEQRFDQYGRQTTNSITLNIPQEFVDNYFGEGERSATLGRNVVPGEEERSAALLNNNINNNKKNSKERNCLKTSKSSKKIHSTQKPLSGNNDENKVTLINSFYPNQLNQRKADRIAERCNTTGIWLIQRFRKITSESGLNIFNLAQLDDLFSSFLDNQQPSSSKRAYCNT